MGNPNAIWSKVTKTDSCWLWTGGMSSGYPCINWDGKSTTVQRIVYMLKTGEDPGKKFVRATCKNKLCMNPEHLELRHTTMDPIVGEARKRSDETRFWKSIVKKEPHECWLWTGHTNGTYGLIFIQGKGIQTHRYSYALAHGEIPAGLIVRHKCDVPLCANPEHLELGSHKDNVKDMFDRGRAASQKPGYKPWQCKHPELTIKGEAHHRAKLTNEQAKAARVMYESGMTQIEIGKILNVSNSTISLLVRGDRYSIPKAKP